MGVTGIALDWFESYLSERKQFVDIEGIKSEEKEVSTCIIQGSILGPILFLCYINDLYLTVKSLTLKFADDTFGLRSGADLNVLYNEVNEDIKKMVIWFRANKLMLNKEKTKFIIFRSKGKRLPPVLPDLVIDENNPDRPFNPSLAYSIEYYHSSHPNK